jgi:hypothetical protein
MISSLINTLEKFPFRGRTHNKKTNISLGENDGWLVKFTDLPLKILKCEKQVLIHIDV